MIWLKPVRSMEIAVIIPIKKKEQECAFFILPCRYIVRKSL